MRFARSPALAGAEPFADWRLFFRRLSVCFRCCPGTGKLKLQLLMAAWREIRADFDRETIVVYQAYRPEIAAAALKAGRFVAPFSFERMTWIKPSFLWLMARSNWGRKRGQECTLAIRISRNGWDRSL